jgi:hypothetical protein
LSYAAASILGTAVRESVREATDTDGQGRLLKNPGRAFGYNNLHLGGDKC